MVGGDPSTTVCNDVIVPVWPLGDGSLQWAHFMAAVSPGECTLKRHPNRRLEGL